jgi:drug/metabolite transporter (DMT)-like permease
MIQLILSIMAFTAMMMIFKLIEKNKANTFQAIVFNYITASVLGFFLMGTDLTIAQITHSSWMENAIVVGGSFIFLFYLIGITAQKVGISVSTVANKMSVIIPVVFAFFLYNDKVTFIKITGIVLALAGVFMTTHKEESARISKKLLILPLVLFIGSGLLDTYINYTEKYFLANAADSLAFIPTVFSVSAITGGLIMITQLIIRPSNFNFKSLLWGILLGFFNYTSLYYFLEALKLDLESSVVFSINNIGIVSLSALSALIFFKEPLSKINKTGVIVSIIAIAMIAFA